MRGKLYQQLPRTSWQGITPAHAGKTNFCERFSNPDGDHPRACGENDALEAVELFVRGSPPRMRGKHCGANQSQAAQGITPAHAGKTQGRERRPEKVGDHPRACGENLDHDHCRLFTKGSPPRMRGKPPLFCYTTRAEGITPAHAGKTLRKGRISVVDPSPQPRSSLTSRRADASIGSQRAPCAAPV